MTLQGLFSVQEVNMIQTVEMTDIGNGRPSNQDAYLMKKEKFQGTSVSSGRRL